MFSGLDTSTGDLVTMREWKLVCSSAAPAKTAVKSLQWADSTGGQGNAGKILKQVSKFVRLAGRLVMI